MIFTLYSDRLYNQSVVTEMMSGDTRVLWIIEEYKEKFEKQIRSTARYCKKSFDRLSAILWALDEIRDRVIFKDVHAAMYEISCFIEQADTYPGVMKRQRQTYEVAANIAQTVYDRLQDEFQL